MSGAKQTVIPMVTYEDGLAMMDWLVDAFGLVEKERWIDDDGRLVHGELLNSGSSIMVASPTDTFQSMNTVRVNYEPARNWMELPYVFNGVLLTVEDIETHFRRATEKGAVILSPIENDGPGPHYRVEDPEGHRWYILQA